MMNSYQVKEYEEILVEDMVADPAAYAAEHGLVNSHSIETRQAIGAWRWPGIFQHRDDLVRKLINAENAIDFGGAAGPIGYGAKVVDMFATQYKALWDVPGPSSLIFSSHTLEHVPDLATLLGSMRIKLARAKGILISFVPSWRLEHLRACNWPYHCHTFCLAADNPPDRDETWLPLDAILAQLFEVTVAEHTDDGCIYTVAEIT